MPKNFAPDYAVHPGATLKESLEKSGMNQVTLAERTGLSRKTINGIINGKEPLTHETALQLEKVFRVPARFWANLQANFDEATARLKERERLQSFRHWIKECGIPYAELAKRGVVPNSREPIERLSAVLRFFGVAAPEAFASVWDDCEEAYSFRKSEKVARHFGAIAAWVRLGELEAEAIETAPFEKKKLEASLAAMRSMSLLPYEQFQHDLVARCAEVGIALVFVPGIKGAPIYGATRWITPRRAIVQLSLRGKDDGNLWFTFFHELGHILLHDKKKVFLELDKAEDNKQEEEANQFARDLLIPENQLEEFLARNPRKNSDGFSMLSKKAIRAFAESLDLPPGVVVGRLQKDKIIPHTHCNDLKQRFSFCDDDK